MGEQFLQFKEKFLKYVNSNKKQCKAIGAIIIILTLILGINLINSNPKKAVALVKERDESLEGATISELLYSKSNELKKGPAKSYGKVVYLTIDDGPSEYTNQIINILNENNVKATFFMIEGRMQEYQSQVKNIVDNGNSAGFHSITHDIHKLYVNDNAAKEEFDTNQKTFESITGKKSYLIRFPFGSKPYTPRASYEAIVSAGYKIWDWNLDTEDWKSTTDQIISSVENYSKDKENIILLMHEREQSVAALDKMIKYLKGEGYEFLAIQESEEEKNFWLENLSQEDN